MRSKFVALLGAMTVTALLVPVVAQATTVEMKPEYKTNKAGAGTDVNFKVFVTPTPGVEYPPPGKRAEIFTPKGQKVDFKPFLKNTCTKEVLLQRGNQGCKQKAKIGTGGGEIGTRLGDQAVHQKDVEVSAYAGPLDSKKRPVLNMYAVGYSPISAQVVLQGVLFPGRKGFENVLDVDIPPIHTSPGSPDASILAFDMSLKAQVKVKVKKKGKTVTEKRYLVNAPKTCPSDGLHWEGEFYFTNGEQVHAEAKTPCPKGAKRAR